MIQLITNENGFFFMNGGETVAVITHDGRFFSKTDVGLSGKMPTPSMTKEEILRTLYRSEYSTEEVKTSSPWYKFW